MVLFLYIPPPSLYLKKTRLILYVSCHFYIYLGNIKAERYVGLWLKNYM